MKPCQDDVRSSPQPLRALWTRTAGFWVSWKPLCQVECADGFTPGAKAQTKSLYAKNMTWRGWLLTKQWGPIGLLRWEEFHDRFKSTKLYRVFHAALLERDLSVSFAVVVLGLLQGQQPHPIECMRHQLFVLFELGCRDWHSRALIESWNRPSIQIRIIVKVRRRRP